MPLSPPQPREHIHTRDITCTGYRREDGLWDIEGHLTDTKTYAFSNAERGDVPPGVPVHEMWIRLTVTDRLEIKEVEAATDYSPYILCRDVTPNFQRLVGLRIGPGLRAAPTSWNCWPRSPQRRFKRYIRLEAASGRQRPHRRTSRRVC